MNEHKCPIQANRIIDYMRSHGSITTKEAMTELGVLRLASRIHELRSSGYSIGDVYINVHDRYGNEARVKKYFLVEEQKKVWIWKYKDMTKEEALAYHRMMWGDMAEKFGDNPTAKEREDFKNDWVLEHFGKPFVHSCVLCEFVKKRPWDDTVCRYCPIDWSPLEDPEGIVTVSGRCYNAYKNDEAKGDIYRHAPISEILALPERKYEEILGNGLRDGENHDD